jgi:hypothetical protein
MMVDKVREGKREEQKEEGYIKSQQSFRWF